MPKDPYTGTDPDPTPYLCVSEEMRMKDRSKPYDAKTSCWVPHDIEGFALGEITGVSGDQITVNVNGTVKQKI